jgi:thiol-disulfide isomerase/thioredoxin
MTTHGPLGRYGQAPALPAVEGWLDVPGDRPAGLEGRVVLVDFWTYSCVNCVRTLPHLRALDERYRTRGLTVLGVHTPEFAFERERRNVERAVRRHGLRYPVALDNAYATWNAWGVGWWPSTYLVDRAGEVRYFHVGEGAEAETEAAIRALLDEPPSPSPSPPEARPVSRPDRTPEVRLGARRARDYVQRLAVDRSARYRLPRSQLHRVSLGGEWRVEAERIVAGRDAVLRLSYAAAEVFVVLAEPAAGRGTATVAVDGAPPRTLTVSRDDLYPLVAAGGGEAGRTLELRLSPGTAAYTFSFG